MVPFQSIDEAIKQNRPIKSEEQRAMVNLMYTSNWVTEQIKSYLAPFGITSQQFNILRILRGSHPEPMTTSVIRSRMLDKMSDVSRLVDRLERKGLVSKRGCASDKRLVDVNISEDGLRLLAEIDSKELDMNKIAAGLSKEECALLSQLLDKLRNVET